MRASSATRTSHLVLVTDLGVAVQRFVFIVVLTGLLGAGLYAVAPGLVLSVFDFAVQLVASLRALFSGGTA